MNPIDTLKSQAEGIQTKNPSINKGKELPIALCKNEIITSVQNNSVTIISAETGSGKSTQVCQYLYEACYDVVVTEPRRLAAVSLADRVAEEMGDSTLVSYHTGFESTESNNTHILFCTDGLQLVRSLIKTNSTRNKVLIIDEIHEWNLNQETLVAWIKLQMSKGAFAKVVIMSATMEVEALKEYFNVSVNTIEVKGTNYPVTSEYYDASKLIPTILSEIAAGSNILVFVAGKSEMYKVIDDIEAYTSNAIVLPLHGELTMTDQKKAFASYSKAKVVVSTNVAQTSVTVPDIDCVIDTGLERRNECRGGIQGVFLNNISTSDIKQRAGRAGRTKPGKYYLCSDISVESRKTYSISEIERSLLDQVVLRLVAAKVDVMELEFFHQPKDSAIERAYSVLNSIGAIYEGNITEIGKKMVRLPVSARFSRMLVESEKYNLVDETITLVATLETGSILENKAEYPYDIMNASKSDIIAIVKLFNEASKTPKNKLGIIYVNPKKLYRTTILRDKLELEVSRICEITSGGTTEDMTKVYLSGMVDVLIFKNYSGFFHNGNLYDIDNKSVVSEYETSIVIGTPTIIEFKDKYGWPRTKYLLRDCCPITIELLMEMFPDRVNIEPIWSEMEYSEWSGRYYIAESVMFDGKEVTIIRKTVDETKYADRLMELYKQKKAEEERLRLEREKERSEFYRDNFSFHPLFPNSSPHAAPVNDDEDRRVEIDGAEYDVLYTYSRDCGYVHLSAEQLFKIENTTTVKNSKGKSLDITCDGVISKNVQDLKNKISDKIYRDFYDTIKGGLYEAKSAKTSILREYVKHIGMREQTRSGVHNVVYVGLYSEYGKVGTKVFKDFEEYKESTTLSLKFYTELYIAEQFGEKKFRINVNGKPIMTKKSESIQKKFLMLANSLVQEVTIENYNDILEMIDESFNDSINELEVR